MHFDPAQADTTSLPVWLGATIAEPSEVRWLPGLTTTGTVHRPYESGEQAIFFSRGIRTGKISITEDHFEIIDELSIPGHEDKHMPTTEIRRIAKSMEASTGDEKQYLKQFRKFLKNTNQNSATAGNRTYMLMDKNGFATPAGGPMSTKSAIFIPQSKLSNPMTFETASRMTSVTS